MAIKKQLSDRTLKDVSLGRRRFIQQASVVGASAAIINPFASTPSYAATPKTGGRIRVGLSQGSTSDSLDPGTIGANSFIGVMNYAKHNHLADIGNSGNLEPELAVSWEPSNGVKTWTFKLRKDVVFHNGKTMNSEDVVASINYHRDENSKSAGRLILSNVKDIKTDGPNTVIFHLTDPDTDFPYSISEQYFMILPSEDGQINWRNGFGSGPFVLNEFEPGRRAFFTKNKNYFKEGRPYFDEMELITIADPTARSNALLTGAVDLIDRVDFKTAHLIGKNRHINLEETKGMLHYTLPMHSDVYPFNNNDVRQALKYSIDREHLVKTVLRGHGTVGNDHPISDLSPYHASHLEQRQYDPDKARFHLKRAGIDKLTVPLHVSDAAFAGAVDTGVLYSQHASKAGINIEVVREASDGYWSNVWLKKPWCASFWLGRASVNATMQLGYASGAAWNESHFENERFNKLLKMAKAELDTIKRREMYYETQQILRDEGGSVIPMFGNYLFASSTKLQHGEMRADRDLDGQKFSERWWFS